MPKFFRNGFAEFTPLLFGKSRFGAGRTGAHAIDQKDRSPRRQQAGPLAHKFCPSRRWKLAEEAVAANRVEWGAGFIIKYVRWDRFNFDAGLLGVSAVEKQRGLAPIDYGDIHREFMSRTRR